MHAAVPRNAPRHARRCLRQTPGRGRLTKLRDLVEGRRPGARVEVDAGGPTAVDRTPRLWAMGTGAHVADRARRVAHEETLAATALASTFHVRVCDTVAECTEVPVL